MEKVAFKQVDVFTQQPYRGSPVAVILDGSSLSSQQMQQIAQWTQLSETVFVLPATDPQADYYLRIFTPDRELAFAGHPTLGAAYALLEAQQIVLHHGQVIQQCQAGLITIQISQMSTKQMLLAFSVPSPQITQLSEQQIQQLADHLACSLSVDYPALNINIGSRWLVAKVANVNELYTCQPDYLWLANHDRQLAISGVTLYADAIEQGNDHIVVRSFTPSVGINEDPVCGSGNACVAVFMQYYGDLHQARATIYASQGQCLGRNGQLILQWQHNQLSIAGQAITCLDGSILLP